MEFPAKPAPLNHPVLDVIRDRWSPLALSDAPVGEEKIALLLEAARWAPSSYNEQPWRYVYAEKGDAGREALESLLAPGNAWAKNAGLLLLSFAKQTFTFNGKENRHGLHDTGAASGYLALQATALGLVSHQMAGYDVARANAALGVPDEFIPGSMIAIGYPGDPAELSPSLREREEAPRSRKGIQEFTFRSRYSA